MARGMSLRAKQRMLDLWRAHPCCPRCDRPMVLHGHGGDTAILFHPDVLICHTCCNHLRAATPKAA